MVLGRAFMKDHDITFYKDKNYISSTPSNCTKEWKFSKTRLYV